MNYVSLQIYLIVNNIIFMQLDIVSVQNKIRILVILLTFYGTPALNCNIDYISCFCYSDTLLCLILFILVDIGALPVMKSLLLGFWLLFGAQRGPHVYSLSC